MIEEKGGFRLNGGAGDYTKRDIPFPDDSSTGKPVNISKALMEMEKQHTIKVPIGKSVPIENLLDRLENLEKGDCGDFEIKFHCKSTKETSADGTRAIILPSRTFNFSDETYEYHREQGTYKDGYPYVTVTQTDNIVVNETQHTVVFHQSNS